MSRLGLTIPTGTVAQSTAHVTTDADRDRYLASAFTNDTAGIYTRPSGEPRRHEQGRNEAQGWSDRQQSAARQLVGYWHTALPLRGLPGSYSGGKRGGGEISADEAEVAQVAWDSYCGAMQQVQSRCSPRHEALLREVVIHGGAVVLGQLHLVREALTFLADEFGLDGKGRKR